MTLAVILSLLILYPCAGLSLGVIPAPTRSSGQQTTSGNAADWSAAQTQNPIAPTPAAPAPAKKASGQAKPAVPKHHPRHKKATPANCVNSAAATPAASGDPSTAANASTNCPPPKIVVHNGGTSEPATQLTGGTGGNQASLQRASTDQLLGSVDTNLKKIAGRQLNANQQDMVNQIHQFVDQSKAAVAAGDLDRGRNLALKARLLSDELVKP